jgi:hypothetical protein
MPGRYYGKYTGIVEDNSDPNKLGHLQLTVPAIFPADERIQARAALPYGFFFVPENEAKVWVEFEGGDPGLPIWTGIQYMPGEWAPEAEADPPQKRLIKTASGHLILFADKSGEEKIEIRDGVNGHLITLDQQGITVEDGVNGHKMTLSASGVKLEDGVNQHSVEMAAAGVTVTAGTGAKVELTAATTTVDGGPGMVQVKGSMIMLSTSAAMPVLRANIDMGVGNLGAPVPLIGPGNLTVLA